MDSIIILLIVFAGIVILPPISRKIGIPSIVAEIVFGMIIGKSLLNIVPNDSTISFFSTFGLIYLMFLGGLEVNYARIDNRSIWRALIVIIFSLGVPFLSGYYLGSSFVDVPPVLLGTMFCTTSLGISLPLIREFHFSLRFLQVLLTSVIMVDVLSIYFLAFVLNYQQDSLTGEVVYSIVIILALFILPLIIRLTKIGKWITSLLSRSSLMDIHVKIAFALIFLMAVISDRIGFHSIIGAFIAGLIVSELLPESFLKEEKLQSFGYGFFIPMFFIFTGAKVNLPGLFANLDNIIVLLAIIIAGILSKVTSVGTVSMLLRFKFKESLAMGVFHAARLSLILASADIALSLNLIQENIFASLVIMAIVSSIIAPVIARKLLVRRDVSLPNSN